MSLKVWYIDDEPDLCELFFEFFTSAEVEIKTFTDPAEALECAKTDTPDLLFIDFRLPNITGDALAMKFPASIPKYLISGDINLNVQYRFEKIFPKPYPEGEIGELLKAHSKVA